MKIANAFFIGMDKEMVAYSAHSKGWATLKIPKEYRNQSNYEMYCYLKYCGMDAEMIFQDKISELVK